MYQPATVLLINMKKKILSAVSLASFAPAVVFAQRTIDDARSFLDETHAPTGLSPTKNVIDLVVQVIQVGLGLVGFIFLCLMVYAGFMWMLDRGNEDRAATAKATFTAAVAGVVVIVAAYAISVFITDFVS